MHKIAWDSYKYVHTDVWRGQKYYTTLNIGIVSIAIALLRIPGLLERSSLVVIPLFGIGVVTSIFGYFSIRKLRENFLRNIAFKTLVEHLLKNKLQIEKAGVSKKHRLSPVYHLKEDDISQVLSCPDLWVAKNIVRRGGVTWCFLKLQIFFVIANLFGILATVLLYFNFAPGVSFA